MGCDFKERFKDMRIIFDTTFCGEWAGKEWEQGVCKAKTGVQTCEEYVLQHLEVYRESWWEVRGLKWFQKGGVSKWRWDRR